MTDWREGRVLQRLRGHDEDVLCVAWCPVPGENFKTYQDLDNPNSQSPNGNIILSVENIKNSVQY